MDICVWGDSITYGSSDAEALGWVGRLRKSRSPGKDEDATYERGICGDTSRGLVARFATEFDAMVFKPEVVIFAFGMNDSSRRGSNKELLIPEEEFRSNMRQALALAKERVEKIYVIGITNVDEKLTNPLPTSRSGKSFSNSDIRVFNELLKEVSAENKVPFIEVFGLLEDLDLADGVHPNASGYQKLFAIISEQLR